MHVKLVRESYRIDFETIENISEQMDRGFELVGKRSGVSLPFKDKSEHVWKRSAILLKRLNRSGIVLNRLE